MSTKRRGESARLERLRADLFFASATALELIDAALPSLAGDVLVPSSVQETREQGRAVVFECAFALLVEYRTLDAVRARKRAAHEKEGVE